MGEDVVLAPGATVAIENSDVRLSFERVLSDSRCAKDVQCVWAGNAAARLQVRVANDPPRAIDINSTVEPRSGQLKGYVMRFVALAPDPVSTASIDPANYRLTLRIERP